MLNWKLLLCIFNEISGTPPPPKERNAKKMLKIKSISSKHVLNFFYKERLLAENHLLIIAAHRKKFIFPRAIFSPLKLRSPSNNQKIIYFSKLIWPLGLLFNQGILQPKKVFICLPFISVGYNKGFLDPQNKKRILIN